MSSPLKLDFNERSDKLSPLASESIDASELWRYPDRQPLETEIARLNDLQSSQVLCTNGGDEAIMILMRLIKETGTLILPLPAFSQYTWGVESWQIDARLIQPGKNLSINTEQLIPTIQDTANSITVITRPNNPTGELIPLNTLLDILETSKQNNGIVFLDEAYIEFSETESVATKLLSQFENLVVLRTLSKAFGLAGIRLGYLMGSETIIDKFKSRCMPFNIAQPSLNIASKAIVQENRQEVVEYCQTIISNRLSLTQKLTEWNIKVLPSDANFITLKLASKQAQAVQSFLKKQGILVRTFDDELMQQCVRITIPYQLDKLLNCLQQALAPQLICLDMDGVLIDTSKSYEATIIETVKQLSGKTVTSQDIETLKNSGGFNNDWVLSQQLLKTQGFDIGLSKVTRVFQEIYLGKDNDGLVSNEFPLIDSKLINDIKAIKQTQFAIVTGRPRNEAKAGQQLVSLDELELISLDDVSSPKPSPQGIQLLQSKYSNFSWMCGDNPDDMQAANASNSLAIGIGKQNAKVLEQAGADIVLNDINELEEWLCPLK